MKPVLVLGFLFLMALISNGQQSKTVETGIIAGNLLDEKKGAIGGASVELISLSDSLFKKGTLSDKDGGFTINSIPFSRYKIRISSVGYKTLVIDSISIRNERFDFNLMISRLKAPVINFRKSLYLQRSL
jgi:hypothetical protein